MTALGGTFAEPETKHRDGVVANTQLTRLAVYLAQLVLDAVAVSIAASASGLAGLSPLAGTSMWLLLVPSFLVINFCTHGYSYEALTSYGRGCSRALRGWLLALGIVTLLSATRANDQELSRTAIFVIAVAGAFLLVLFRLPLAWLVRHVLGTRFMRRLLIVDGVPLSAPASFVRVDAQRMGIAPDLGDPHMLHAFSSIVQGADRVVVSCAPERRAAWAMYLKGVGCWGELHLPELKELSPLHAEAHLGVMGVRVSTGALDLTNRTLKRVLDLSVAVPAIVLLSPLFAVTALAIALDSPGPVLFRQRRMGRCNQLFDVYKFRSMRTDTSDFAGTRSAARDDDRITRVGRFIRATSIDELPQLFNVLRGDMSLVGPRPHALGSLAGTQLFWQVDQRYWLRHAIKPGVTGLAQVRGYRGATDHEDDLANRLVSDLEYVSGWSITRDIGILCRTLLVLVHKNAY